MRRGQPGRLSPLSLKQLAKTIGLHADGGGLYLAVTQNKTTGALRQSWVFLYIKHRKRTMMGGGSLHTISLAMAREWALEQRRLLQRGTDPLAAKRQHAATAAAASGKAVTFDECARRYHAEHQAKWSNQKHVRDWLTSLRRHISPHIGGTQVAAVDLAAVIRALEPVWNSKPRTGSALRAKIENVLDFAKVSGWRDGDNPASWSLLSKRLASASKLRPVVHMPAMRWQEVPAFLAELRKITDISAAALEFCILTWARPSEGREAEWDEVDFEAATWTVPPTRMKGKREHRVPLSDAAVAVLRRMAEIRQSQFVFPGQSGGPVSKDTLRRLMHRMGHGDSTRHGFRSAAADWRAEATQFDVEVQEACLAHLLGDETQRSYQRGSMFEKRRKLMDAWSTYCAGKPADVVPLRPVAVS
jgi:integrase